MLKQDHRVGRALTELVDEAGDAIAQEVVAEVHAEGAVADKLLGRQHRVGQTARCILRDEGDFEPKLRAIADGGANLVTRVADDDADLADARFGHRLKPVEQDRLARDRDQLLGARVRDGAQPRARAAREYESLDVHYGQAYRNQSLSLGWTTAGVSKN